MVGALGSRYIEKIRDIIVDPPAEHAYDFIKSEVIKRVSPPQEHKTRQLLEHEKIGDRKPSQFLRRLRNFASNIVAIHLVEPISLQLHLVTRTSDRLDQLAYTADIIMNTARTTSLRVAETARPSGIHDAE